MTLHQKHYAELKASCISDAIIERYFFSIEGEAAQRHIIEDALGELKGHSAQYATAPVRKLLRQSDHLKEGAWGCTANGQLKPDSPRAKWQKDEHGLWKEVRRDDGSLDRIKYEIIREKPYKGAHVSVIEPIGAAISDITLVSEGSKKAGSLASLGYQAIGLPGIEMGLTAKDDNGDRFLIPALQQLAEKGKTIAIAPDVDAKQKTKQNVARAVKTLARKFEAAGGKVLVLPEWAIEHGKGIDDVQASQGAEYIHELIAKATPFKQWQALQMAASLRGFNAEYYGLTAERTIVNQRYISFSLPAPGTGLAISSPMETGKTVAGGKLKAEFFAKHPDGLFELMGYRNGLGQQTAQKWGMEHISELEVGYGLNALLIQDAAALAYCADSLNRRAAAILQAVAEGRKVCIFLDEADAVLKHILGGGTLGKRQAEIWALWCECLSGVANGGGYIILAEAHLSQLAVDAIAVISGAKFELIENQYQPHKGRKIYDYSALNKQGKHADQLLRKACFAHANRLVDEGPLFIGSDAQSFAEELEASFAARGLKGLRVDGDSKDDTKVIAFLQNPDAYIAEHKPAFIVATTTAESGVSISDGYFKNVVLYGSHLEDRALAQLSGRVRGMAPLHAFAKHRVGNFGDDADSFSVLGIIKEWEKNAAASFSAAEVTRYFDGEILKASAEATRSEEGDQFHTLKAKYQARKNISNFSLHYGVFEIFKGMGADIEPANLTPSAFTDIEKEAHSSAREFIFERRTQEFTAAELDKDLGWALRISESASSSKADRVKARKIILSHDYPGLPLDDAEFVRDEIVKARCEKLRAHTFSWMCLNPKIAQLIDLRSWKSQLEQRFIVLPSLRKESARVKVLAQSALIQITELDSYCEDTALVSEMASWAKGRAQLLNRLFRLQIKDSQSNVAIVNKLLRKIGYVAKWVSSPGRAGEQVRHWAAKPMPHQAEVWTALEHKWAKELEAETLEIEQPQSHIHDLHKDNSSMQIVNMVQETLSQHREIPPLDVAAAAMPDPETDLEGYIRAIEALDREPQLVG